MLILADFNVIKPDFGLLFWTSLFFILFWVLIGKFAFKPIARALKQREEDIQGSLDEARKAREEMAGLVAENEKLLMQAREERAEILKEAKELKDQIIAEARDKAREEAQLLINNAREAIENLKREAMVDVKNQAGLLALEVAERVIRKELKSDDAQRQYVNMLVQEIKPN